MPIYEYEREDGSRFETIQKISEDPLKVCPTTGQKVKRLISESAFHLKGGGWYKTDYNSSSSSSSGKSSKSAEKSESSSTSTEKSSKPCGSNCGCH
ncbi:MAG: zinc ribbon domain-containing protein [Deltaproteobacteria bacterium]|nr:zinc ribbon domain-containing protein [Deltaproteobacteria bacterium]